jgi:hypothetical protein
MSMSVIEELFGTSLLLHEDEVTDCEHYLDSLLIVGCDANTRHILWGCTGTNLRGESLVEFLVNSNLNILNQSNGPTFVVCNRKEVTDLTPGTNKIGHLVTGMYLMSHICQITDTFAFK